jgi:ABC-type multidrug transport system fused ATPase/permease subunit
MGRIINRFTYDTEVIDVTLTQAMAVFMISWSWFIAGISIMAILLPWMLLILFPVISLYWMMLLYYRKSGSDLQRLDAVSRSPIQAMLAEAMDGGTAIRLFHQQKTFIDRFYNTMDSNSSALINFVSAQRWLGFRIELMGSTVALAAAILIVSLNDAFGIDTGLVGLLIIWSSHFTITLGFMIDSFAESEAAITSIERVDAMSQIPQERARVTDISNRPPSDWPSNGQLEFSNVCMRYRPELPLALDHLSFVIPAGKKCGIVGRTGSGKSSLCSVLFRLVEVESGTITVDGVDLGRLGLSDVRGRSNGLAIIPQDPYVVGNTLRQCVDPFGQSTDDDVMECLRAVRIATGADSLTFLDSVVEDGGSNYSVGERQLLNLARALLSKPKILVLDEVSFPPKHFG